MITLALIGGAFAAVAAVVGLNRRARIDVGAQLIRAALQHPERRAEAIAWLRREIGDLEREVSMSATASGGRRRYAPLRSARLALAEILLLDEHAAEALVELSHLALPALGETIETPAWADQIRLIGCQAELLQEDADAAARWMSAAALEAHRSVDRTRALDLAAQMALVRGAPEEALRLLDRAGVADTTARATFTRERTLALLGRDRAAAGLLRALPRELLERVRRRYADEPVAAIAEQLLHGPYR